MKTDSINVSSRSPVRRADVVLALMLAIFSFASAWMHAQNTNIGVPPDEWAQLTYVNEIAVDGRLVPDYANSRVLPARIRLNYLNHPPLYYSILGLVGRVQHWNAVSDFRNYRALSAAMVALGIFLWSLTARAMGLPALWVVAFAAASNAIPMFAFLAGSVNNDNLAYLGVAMAFYGLVNLRPGTTFALCIGALGVLVTLLSKATGALFICLFFLAWAAPQMRDPSSPLRDRRLWLAMLVVGLVAGGYFAYAQVAYGSPFPRPTDLYVEYGPPEKPLATISFAAEFARQMIARLPIVLSNASVQPLNSTLRWLFHLMLALPLIAWAISLRTLRRDHNGRIANAFMLALLGTIVVHVFVVREGYLARGLFGGIQPRYYSYALPAFFVMCFVNGRNSKIVGLLFGGFAFAASVLLAMSPALTVKAQLRRQTMTPVAVIRYPTTTTARPQTARIEISPVEAGFVDRLELSAGSANVSGWAIDQSSKRSARNVMVIVNGRVIGITPTGAPRPDVASALHSNKATLSGFDFKIEGVPAGIKPCELHLAAQQGDGSIAMLHDACAGPAH